MLRDGWHPVTLGDLVEIKHGFAFAGEYFRDEPPGDILLTPGNFAIGGGFKAEKFKYYIGPVPDEYALQEGDLLVTMTDLSKAGDTLGYPAIVPARDDRRYLHNQRLGKVEIRPGAAVSKGYLYWVLRTKPYRHEVLASATGTTVKHTSPARIAAFRFELPPLWEQDKIASLLGALDDKIELNRHTNEALEAMARALFKSWFVDFDPVRARMEGRQPYGMDVQTAALFPDHLERSDSGHIPIGWSVSSLDALFPGDRGCVITGPFGSNLHASDYRRDGVPLILVNHVDNGRIVEYKMPRVGYHKLPELDRYRLQTGDIVFTRVGAVGRSAYIHTRQVGWMISGQTLRVRVDETRRLHSRYLAQVYLEPSFIDMVESYALGSTRPSLNTGILRSFQFLLPPLAIQSLFCNVVASFDACIQNNLDQARTLALTRDTVLPQLLSGEMRSSDAVTEVEAVV